MDQQNSLDIKVIYTESFTDDMCLDRLWLHNMGKGIDHEPVTSRQLPKSIGCGKNFMGREALNTREKVSRARCLVRMREK